MIARPMTPPMNPAIAREPIIAMTVKVAIALPFVRVGTRYQPGLTTVKSYRKRVGPGPRGPLRGQVLDAADTEVTVPAIDLNLAALYALARASERDDLASVPADSDLLNQYHGPASLSCRYKVPAWADNCQVVS